MLEFSGKDFKEVIMSIVKVGHLSGSVGRACELRENLAIMSEKRNNLTEKLKA